MTFLSLSFQKACKITTASALVIAALTATISPAKADNLAVSNQEINQTGVAVGTNNNVTNHAAQFNIQKQKDFNGYKKYKGYYGPDHNTAISNMNANQTGVAVGKYNKVTNKGVQLNGQIQKDLFGF